MFLFEKFLTLACVITIGIVNLAFLYLNITYSIQLYFYGEKQAAIEVFVFTIAGACFMPNNFIYLFTRFGRLIHTSIFKRESYSSLINFAFKRKKGIGFNHSYTFI